MVNPETKIQNDIKYALKEDGWFVIRHQQGPGSLRGMSDLTALKDGVTIYIEIKTDKGRLSEYQKAFRQEILNHNGRYIVARSVEDIAPYLTSTARLF